MIVRVKNLQAKIIAAFDAYQFSEVYQLINQFCIVDLGGFYLDILKDRLYTSKRDGLPRRSAQTAMYYILETMVRWLAPIVSYTADEIWQHIPWRKMESVFLSKWFDEFPELPKQDDLFWQDIIRIRMNVNKELENLRAAGKIGSALEATVILHTDNALCEKLKTLGDELRFVLITSEARAVNSTSKTELKIEVVVSDSPKCVRCWHRRADVGSTMTHPELCARCVVNIDGEGEVRFFA
ncbi:MAG: isoleucyl-tRNA synthetase [uncultured bacterium]|nr:MAG: isoleucyl-tRNA synthetase [uncultured bacterium]